MAFDCKQCGASFSKFSLLQEHRRIRGHRDEFKCTICSKTFGRRDNYERHLKRHADSSLYQCNDCGMLFSRPDNLRRHRENKHIQVGGSLKRPLEDGERDEPHEKRMYVSTDNMYDLRVFKTTHIPKFQTTATHYRVDFKHLNIRGLPKILETLKRIFQSLIDNVTEFMSATDLVRLSMECPELDFPITLPFMKVSTLTADKLLTEIERVLQSYEEFVLDQTLEMEITHVILPIGGVGKRCSFVDLDKMMKTKRCFIRIQNKDELCCARAIITAKAKGEKHPQWESIRHGGKLQETMAKELHVKVGVPLQKCGIREIKQFQNTLHEYQIIVLSKEHFNAIIYAGPEREQQIYLYQHDNHYDVITSITAFLNKNYYCTSCKQGYDHKEKHKCNNPCVYCRHIHPEETEEWKYCSDCNMYFKNTVCYEKHRQESKTGKTTCRSYYRCQECNKVINVSTHKKAHVCGEIYCKICKDYFTDDHKCYMQTNIIEADPKLDHDEMRDEAENIFIFFDFECTQDDMRECEKGHRPGTDKRCINCKKSWCGSFIHQPNLCVVNKTCDRCLKNDVTSCSRCDHCGKNERIFHGPDTTQEFCKWLFSEENYGARVLCHNFKGYDSYPILNYLYQNGILPEVITNGSKYLSIYIAQCRIRFLDSINFLPMALAELPEAFGIKELTKGYFPHLFNRKENQNSYLLHLPDVKYYHPDGMKPKAREAFMDWYEKNKGNDFNFRDELLKYCRSDVDILRKCCLQFRDMFIEMTNKDNNGGIDPFENCITIASACNLVFRTNFLESESIGIIPPHGYRQEDKQSIKAIQWLKYISHTEGTRIQHALNDGERRIGPYKVDGYMETDCGEKIVFEYHGCFWHGCPKCYSRSTVNPVTDCTMADLHMRTLDKQRYLQDQGYSYRCVWECEFEKHRKLDEHVRSFIDSLEIEYPLEPRDAFYGGRTEAFTMYAESSDTIKIKYYDVTSLYPYINKVGKVPLGHPNVITEEFEDIDNYEGLMKCRILPPRELYIPVLPYRSNGKLLFPLCRKCAEMSSNEACCHRDKDRAITGTWVTDEVKTAIRRGYKLLNVHEVWHFENVVQYNPTTKEGGVFTEYVNTFLKLKQEASGWPKWCKTEEDKDRYIQEYYDKEGILLDKRNIRKNPGLRRLAKLMLNSFWGKFGQRSNLMQSLYTSNPSEYFEMLTSDNQNVRDVSFVSDEMVRMDWNYDSDFLMASSKTNVVVAAYTTAQARLKLYSYLEPLDRRVLYCDTDSIVFTVRDGEWEPSLGDNLGDLTNEVEGSKIVTFVTGGPKNYAYTLSEPNKDGETSCCKIRGITLNHKNSLEINPNTVKDMVFGNKDKVTVRDDLRISRDRKACNLLTRSETKEYKIVFDKRVLKEDYVSLPYGF